jgi:hypothetical protein
MRNRFCDTSPLRRLQVAIAIGPGKTRFSDRVGIRACRMWARFANHDPVRVARSSGIQR